MRRPFVFALLAYLVPTFLLGYVWHLVLFADYYRALAIYRPDPIVPFGFAAMVVQGAILAQAYPRLVALPAQTSSAMRFAAMAALLAWSFTTLAVAAKHPMASIGDFVIIESAFTALQYLLVGPLLALSVRASTPVQAVRAT